MQPDDSSNGVRERFLDDYLPYWLAQASYWVGREFHDEIARAGLTFGEWRVLASLHGSMGEPIGTLGKIAMIKQPTVSKLVRRLEGDGMLQRRDAEDDGRKTLVMLTAKGSRRIGPLIAKALSHQEEVLRPFGKANARRLLRTLKQLVHERERDAMSRGH